jgi:hypothetical protein
MISREACVASSLLSTVMALALAMAFAISAVDPQGSLVGSVGASPFPLPFQGWHLP